MFEVPEAKRVRREDLYDEGAASSDDGDMDQEGPVDPDLQGKLNAQLAGLLDLDLSALTAQGGQDDPAAAPADAAADDAPMDDAPDELAFQFRLFRGETPSHTVVIKQHDEAEAAGPGALVRRRPQSYYLAGEPDAAAAQRFRHAAVTADYLLADARRRRWGLEKPWRVTRITVTTAADGKQHAVEPVAVKPADAPRKRPGKRRRIILRGREKAKKEKEEAAKRMLAEKEEHLLDKKKRLNRQKKLRRRAKKREGKTGDDADAADASSRATTPE